VKPIRTNRLALFPLSPVFLDALVEGRRDEAEAALGLELPPDWPDRHDLGFLRLRRDQVGADPTREPWLPRAIALERRMIGHIGFHGPPGVNGPAKPGAVEVGYTVFEPYRRRGYATEAVVAVLDWAHAEHDVRHFVASVGPWNEPSLALVRRLGFRQTGTQWDDEDGEELVFELEIGPKGIAQPRR
jgi:[ribosomal protein S5]-alanine N-acetyltransferase